jgi:hypothetical protein
LDGLVAQTAKPVRQVMSAWLNRLNTPLLARLCIVSLVLRLLFILLAKPYIHAVEDFNIAEHLARGDGFAYGGFEGNFHPTAMKAPAYPFFLAVFIWAFGEASKLAVVMVQHALFAFLPMVFLRIGTALEMESLGKIAALLFLIHPSYLYYPTVIEVTNLFVPLALCWCAFAIRVVKFSTRLLDSVWFGLLSGVVILTQPIVLLPILTCIAMWFRTKATSLLIIFTALLFPIGIWTARNWLTFETVIPTKSPFYMNLYVGLLPEYTGLNRFEFLDSVKIQQLNSLQKVLDDVQMESHYKAAFLDAVKAKPLLYVQKTCWQALLYWFFPPRYFENISLQFLVVRLLPVVVLNVLFVWGTMKVWRTRRNIALSILLVLLYFTAVYALTHIANIRFKLDIEWLELFVCAAVFQPKHQSLQ